MPRKRVPVSGIHPYHITARCLNREWFKVPMDLVWNIYSDYLFFISHAYGVEILAFVLMHNHFHLLSRFPNENMGEAMLYFMRETSKAIGSLSGRINQIYGAPYHKCLIEKTHYYRHAYKYVYRNPVQAGLCDNVEDYRFSTLSGLLGKTKIWIPLEEDQTLFDDVRGCLDWLNKFYERDHLEAVEGGLRRGTFAFPRDPHSARVHELENLLS